MDSILQTLKKLSYIGLAVSLAGCGALNTIPEDAEGEFSKSMDTKELIDSWKNAEPALTYIDDGGSFVITEPLKLPRSIATMHFESHLSNTGKMSDLAGMLSPLGVYVSIPDQELREKPLVIFEFQGKLEDFLNALGAAYQVSFNWNPGNILTVEKTSMYMVKIPQDESVAKSIAANITSLGGEDVDISLEAGAVSYKADYRTHQRVSNFIEYVSENSALVSMQVAIINVAMDKNKKTGIDWSELNLHLGKAAATKNASTIHQKFEESLKNSNGGTSAPQSGNEGNTDKDTESDSKPDLRKLLLAGTGMDDIGSDSIVGGQGTDLMLSKGDFAIGAVVDYLSTYGKTETTQSLLMKTLSGKEVLMKSAQQIPYIDSVGVSNLTNGNGSSGNSSNNNSSNNSSGSNGNNGNNNSNLGFGTVNIDTIDIGLELKLHPFFQSHSELLTIGVDLSLSSLLSFVNLSAGNQLGSISRPNLQEQEFTDIVKIKAGETVIIGGITYDQKGDSRNAPSFLEKIGGAHKDASFNRNAMIIMIRPTVTVFKGMNEDKKIIRK